MPDGGFDHAVCGATPFAMLLAGLLASVHGKRVCLLGDGWSPYRLPRRIDLSAMPVTRPETWALLKRETPETLRLLGTVGRGLFERADPLFIAETAPEIDRLGHVRWTAAAHGFAAERAVDPSITRSGAICRIRDAVMLVSGRAEPSIEAWLDKLGVARLPAISTTLTTKRDGTATISGEGRETEAASVILADESAILDRQTPSDMHRLLSVVASTAIMTEPAARALPAPLCYYLDRDLVLHQRAARHAVTALAGRTPETARARLAASTGGLGALRPTGQALYRRIETMDGAPLIGRSGRHKLTIVAGLGDAAAFVAPAVARFIADAATDEDRDYFAAREVSKAAHRQGVAERDVASAEAAA